MVAVMAAAAADATAAGGDHRGQRRRQCVGRGMEWRAFPAPAINLGLVLSHLRNQEATCHPLRGERSNGLLLLGWPMGWRRECNKGVQLDGDCVSFLITVLNCQCRERSDDEGDG